MSLDLVAFGTRGCPGRDCLWSVVDLCTQGQRPQNRALEHSQGSLSIEIGTLTEIIYRAQNRTRTQNITAKAGLRQPYRKAEAGSTGRAVTLSLSSPNILTSHPHRVSQAGLSTQNAEAEHKTTRHAKRRTSVGLVQARRCPL